MNIQSNIIIIIIYISFRWTKLRIYVIILYEYDVSTLNQLQIETCVYYFIIMYVYIDSSMF